MIAEDICQRLIDEARMATMQSFLTKPGGTRYGAAVLTATGRVYTSGQYSSFNHSTNVHAEIAVLILATMAKDPDVVALAIASTSAETLTSPCGVCRQVIIEHSARTGRDFTVLMAHRDQGYDRTTVSKLLPFAWTANTTTILGDIDVTTKISRTGELRPTVQSVTKGMEIGDHVLLPDGSIALVWDPEFQTNNALLKIKYAPPNPDGSRRKIAHAFTEPIRYETELSELEWARPAPFGGVAAIAHTSECRQRLPILPIEMFHGQIPELLVQTLHNAGIESSGIMVSGSRATGLQLKESDWDLIIQATPGEIKRLRIILGNALADGQIAIPSSSGSWNLLGQIMPGGKMAIIQQRRFLETFEINGVGFALIFVPKETPSICIEASWCAIGHRRVQGVVIKADHAAYKRAMFTLQTACGETKNVICYHKLANMVREGDLVIVNGWEMLVSGGSCLFQLSSWRDQIRWLRGT